VKRPLGQNVLSAARERIAWVFDTFPNVYVSFSGGKDSTVMLHLAAEEARRRRRRIGILFIDMEGQYLETIRHVRRCYDLYIDICEAHWVALPLVLRNAVSQFEPRWICWDESARDLWIRDRDPMSVCDPNRYPFYRHAMEFEEFVEEFGHWYGRGGLTACLVGIRADESLNRFRTLMVRKSSFEGRRYTTWKAGAVYNVYPIYDWRTEDIWTYHARYPDKPHNRIYDLMHQAGLTIHQARLCQPYGDDQRKGLWLFHVLEPETWARVVARVSGANSGALYAQESGNILGRLKITKPPGHTWESFAGLLLESMPPRTREHYQNKIAIFIHWWLKKGIPMHDECDPEIEARKQAPSWRRVCKALLRHDYWCKGLSFSQTKSQAYERYIEVMRNRRRKWGMYL
jgi:predicted phosphoadenosine phosphosulfate sulfurtransferase